ncbi:hypothetical protein AB0M56_40840, partial [Amycolatopsis sp. NPDC051372]
RLTTAPAHLPQDPLQVRQALDLFDAGTMLMYGRGGAAAARTQGEPRRGGSGQSATRSQQPSRAGSASGSSRGAAAFSAGTRAGSRRTGR